MIPHRDRTVALRKADDSLQWVSLTLPLARLLLSTFLPLAVLILFIKPCSFDL